MLAEAELYSLVSAHLAPIAQAMGVKVYDPFRALPTDDKAHWRLTFLPTEPDVLELCNGGSRYQWIAQVSIYLRDGNGAGVFLPHIKAISDAFPFNTRLSAHSFNFQTTKPPYASALVAGANGWFFRPVNLRLQLIH